MSVGDVILEVNGDVAKSLKDVTRAVAAAKPGESVAIEVWRDGTREALSVVIGESRDEVVRRAPEQSDASSEALGLSLAELRPEHRRRLQLADDIQGALIVSVEPGSSAARKGLRRGDVITMVGQTEVRSAEEAVAAMRDLSSRGSVLLQIARGEGRTFVAVPTP